MTDEKNDEIETVYDLDYDKIQEFMERDVPYVNDVFGFTLAAFALSVAPGLGAFWVCGVGTYVLYKALWSEDWLIKTKVKEVEEEEDEEAE